MLRKQHLVGVYVDEEDNQKLTLLAIAKQKTKSDILRNLLQQVVGEMDKNEVICKVADLVKKAFLEHKSDNFQDFWQNTVEPYLRTKGLRDKYIREIRQSLPVTMEKKHEEN